MNRQLRGISDEDDFSSLHSSNQSNTLHPFKNRPKNTQSYQQQTKMGQNEKNSKNTHFHHKSKQSSKKGAWASSPSRRNTLASPTRRAVNPLSETSYSSKETFIQHPSVELRKNMPDIEMIAAKPLDINHLSHKSRNRRGSKHSCDQGSMMTFQAGPSMKGSNMHKRGYKVPPNSTEVSEMHFRKLNRENGEIGGGKRISRINVRKGGTPSSSPFRSKKESLNRGKGKLRGINEEYEYQGKKLGAYNKQKMVTAVNSNNTYATPSSNGRGHFTNMFKTGNTDSRSRGQDSQGRVRITDSYPNKMSVNKLMTPNRAVERERSINQINQIKPPSKKRMEMVRQDSGTLIDSPNQKLDFKMSSMMRSDSRNLTGVGRKINHQPTPSPNRGIVAPISRKSLQKPLGTPTQYGRGLNTISSPRRQSTIPIHGGRIASTAIPSPSRRLTSPIRRTSTAIPISTTRTQATHLGTRPLISPMRRTSFPPILF